MFPLYDTRFIAVSDNYDSANYAGDTGGLEVAFKFLIHEQYSRDLSKKIRSAAHERMRRGERISRNCVFGYVKTPENRLEIDPDAAETVRLIFKLVSEGKSLSTIERTLYEQKRPTPSMYKNRARMSVPNTVFDCVWGKSVLLKILRDEQYIGAYIAGKSVTIDVGSGKQKKKPESEWIRIPGHHPAIISEKLFDRVQVMINAKGEPLRKREIGTSDRYTHNSPLKGKVFCASCGHTMTLSNTKNAAFHCRFTRSASDAPCHGLRISDKELRAMLIDIIRAQTADMTDTLLSSHSLERQPECGRQISECEDEKRELYERFVRGELEVGEYRTEKNVLDAQLDRLNCAYAEQSEELQGLSVLLQSCDALRSLMDSTSDESTLTSPVADLLIEKVLVFPDRWAEIIWKHQGFGNTA